MLGSAFTTPTDIAKVRLQADGIKGAPRVYKGPMHCLAQVYRQQGVKGLYTGATPNMIRAVLLTSMQVNESYQTIFTGNFAATPKYLTGVLICIIN